MQFKLKLAAFAVASVFPLSAFPQNADSTLEPVIVTAARQAQSADEVLASVDVIDRAEIERAGQSTLVQMLAARPGVQVTSNGGPGASSSVFIRGASSGHTLLLIDGVRVGSATAGAPTLEMIPLALIERVEILRGPASALYGADAIGGVIHIITRRDTAEGVTPRLRIGAGSRDSYSASAGVSGASGRLRYNFDVGHDRTRGFDSRPDANGGTDGDRDGFRNDYANGSLTLGFRERDEVGLSFFHSDGRSQFDDGQPYDSHIDKRVESIGLHVRNQLTADWVSTLRFSQSKDLSHTRSSASSYYEYDTRQRQLSWQNDVVFAGGMLMAAVEKLKQNITSTGSYDLTSRTLDSFQLGWGGQFGRHDVQFNARRDRSSQFGGETTGSAAWGYHVTPEWRVRASVGSAFRVPTFNDLYFPLECFPPWGCFGGNPDLQPEKAVNREIGVTYERGLTSVSATYFNNRVRNLIVWGNTPDNVGKAKLEGLELGVSTVVAGFNLRASYDYLNARDLDTGDRLTRRARHSGSLAIDRSTGDWLYGVEWRAQGHRYDAVPNTSANRLGGYGVTNLYAHYTLAPDWKLEMRVNNVFDKSYQTSRGFATEGLSAFVAVRYAPR